MTLEEYLEILFNDCGYTLTSKKEFLKLRFEGKKHIDELTTYEKSILINDLRELKYKQCKNLH